MVLVSNRKFLRSFHQLAKLL